MPTKLGTNFDGSTDYYSRASALSGVSDSKLFTMSFRFRRLGGFGTTQQIFHSADYHIRIFFSSTNLVTLWITDGSSVSALQVTSSTAFSSNDGWHHFVLSVDMSSTAKRHLLIDGADDLSVVVYQDAALDFTDTAYYYGANPSGGEKLNADISDFYFFPGKYLDLSLTGHLRKFISSSGKAPLLGGNGELPFNEAPAIFFPDGGRTGNYGFAGAFTENGSPAASSSVPEITSSRNKPGTEYLGTEYFDRTSGLTNAQDGQELLVSGVFRRSATGRGAIYHCTNGRFQITFNSVNKLEVLGRNSSNTLVLDAESSVITDTDLHHFLISVDLSLATPRVQIYIDDVDDTDSVTTATSGETIDFTQSAHAIGNNTSHTIPFYGTISALWIDLPVTGRLTGQSLDLDSEANRRLFIDSSVFCTQLGPDGSWPRDYQPIMYFPDGNAYHNAGSGGDFATVAGDPEAVIGAYATSVSPVLSNLQKGSTSISAAGTTTTVTIDSLDRTRSILLFSVRNLDSEPEDWLVSGALTDDDEITFQRFSATGTAVTIEWYILEYSSGVQVEHGLGNFVSTNNSQIISAIDQTKSIPFISVRNSGSSFGHDDCFTADIDTVKNLSLQRGTTNGNTYVAWQIVEFDNAYANKFSTTISASGTSEDLDFGFELDKTKTIQSIGFRDTSATIGLDDVIWSVLADEKVTFKRYASSAIALNVINYVCEVQENLSVQNYEVVIASSTTYTDQTITQVDLNKAAPLLNSLYGCIAGDSYYDDEADKFLWTLDITTATNLEARRGSGDVETSTSHAQILEWTTSEVDAFLSLALGILF